MLFLISKSVRYWETLLANHSIQIQSERLNVEGKCTFHILLHSSPRHQLIQTKTLNLKHVVISWWLHYKFPQSFVLWNKIKTSKSKQNSLLALFLQTSSTPHKSCNQLSWNIFKNKWPFVVTNVNIMNTLTNY